MASPKWWNSPWRSGSPQDPDIIWDESPAALVGGQGGLWLIADGDAVLGDDAILAPLEAEFSQVRSRGRVRDLAEVFTHQREVDAMLDMIPDAFEALDVTFLEPAAGSGNFLTEILRRKLRLVTKSRCVSQAQYEHRLLRAAASIYGVDISPENITEARARMAHVLLGHYQSDANTILPTPGFLSAAALVLGENIVLGDALNAADQIELCEWRPFPGGRFQRIWSYALVPPAERDLFWSEDIQDEEPAHYSQLAQARRVKLPDTESRAPR